MRFSSMGNKPYITGSLGIAGVRGRPLYHRRFPKTHITFTIIFCFS